MTYTLISSKVKSTTHLMFHVVLQWDKYDGYLIMVFKETDVPMTAESAEGDNLVKFERKVIGSKHADRPKAINAFNRMVKKYWMM